MLCSRCSAIIKPVVAIDIDGTLGNYHGHFLAFAQAYLGLRVITTNQPGYGGGEPFRDWFCREFRTDVTTFRQIKLAYRQGGMKRTMPPEPGCSVLVHALRTAGAEVWLTTTRPYLRLDNIDPDTRFWLNQQSIEFDGMLYDEDKYKLLGELVDPNRVVAVLDDLEEQCDAAAVIFGPDVPILRRNDYNRDMSLVTPEVNDLREALGIINQRVQLWKEQHNVCAHTA
jgi:hypothetical protein